MVMVFHLILRRHRDPMFTVWTAKLRQSMGWMGLGSMGGGGFWHPLPHGLHLRAAAFRCEDGRGVNNNRDGPIKDSLLPVASLLCRPAIGTRLSAMDWTAPSNTPAQLTVLGPQRFGRSFL